MEDMRKDPKKYMRMAVEVMKNSIPEKKKTDPSPYVGAVLVFPDGTFETAYRGEFREGDHAEYTLLDKKNRNRELTDCWLFATLEPCAPETRNEPKMSCAERIVNARISRVWFGVEDRNPKVDHGGINHMVYNGVVVQQFDPEFHKEIEEINVDFMRWANFKNAEAKVSQIKHEDLLNEIATSTSLSNLSHLALQKFLTESGRDWTPDSEDLIQELKDMELVIYDDTTNEYLLTGNAILLFGKRPRNKFPQAAVKAKVIYGDGETGAETFDEPIVLIPDKVVEWLKKVLPATLNRLRIRAEQIPAFPIEVIREALVNAILCKNLHKMAYVNQNIM